MVRKSGEDGEIFGEQFQIGTDEQELFNAENAEFAEFS
jgi:hypothetical protein